ncbi:MAG: hypothetical protein IK126_04595 [Bacteroidales bacterium]|nr:hypothetical protein [Bacteroidales bacterium]
MPSKPHSRYLDDPLFSFANSTMALLNTSFFNHELAMALNHAYNLKLRRIDDCPLGNNNYPCFIFHDPSTRLTFVMLDRSPAAPMTFPFENYDKLLIVRGRDSRQFVQQLYDDITTRRPEPLADDLSTHHHWQSLNQLQEGIIDAAIFTFLPNGQPADTSLFNGPATAMPRRLQTYLTRLRHFLTTVFATFEWALTNPDELE